MSRVAVIAGAACGLVLALAAGALLGRRETPRPAATQVVKLGQASLVVPPDWHAVSAGRSTLVLDTPGGERATVKLVPVSVPGASATATRIAGYRAWREGRVTVLPTSAGDLTVTCGACVAAIRSLSVRGAEIFDPSPELALALRAPDVLARLNRARLRGRADLRRATTPSDQGIWARRLAAAHARAADALRPVAGGPLLERLSAVRRAYSALDRAAAAGSAPDFDAARTGIRAAETELTRAVGDIAPPQIQQPTAASPPAAERGVSGALLALVVVAFGALGAGLALLTGASGRAARRRTSAASGQAARATMERVREASGTAARGLAATARAVSVPAVNRSAANRTVANDPLAGGPMAHSLVANGPATSGPVASGPVASGPMAYSLVADGPATSGPVASGPAASSPVASSPATSGPATSGPVASGPAASSPVASSSATSGPPASAPAASGPLASRSEPPTPVTSRPVLSEQLPGEPVAHRAAASGPAASGPTTSGPAASGPAASGPAISAPPASAPAASDPRARRSEPPAPVTSRPVLSEPSAGQPVAPAAPASGPAANGPEPRRPAPRPQAPAPDPDAKWTCELTWSAGVRRAGFCARATAPGEAPVEVARSPKVSWPPLLSPSPDAELVAAARTVARALVKAGWTPTTRGRSWYAQRFAWARDGAPPELGTIAR